MKNHFFLICVLSLSLGCGGDDNNSGNNANNQNNSNNVNNENNLNNTMDMGDGDRGVDMNLGEPDPPFPDCTITVWPQATANETYQLVQTAFFDVESGGVVCFVEGRYNFDQEISLDVANVELRGESQENVILDFSEQTMGANGISVVSDGFTISRMTVRNTPGDAIRVTGAIWVTFENVTVSWSGGPNTSNGAYGIYPVQCENVLIDSSIVSFASDAGIYVGQSMNIIIRDSEAFGNVAGIEIENSSFAEVFNNHSHDNTAGLLVFDLPSPPIQGGRANKVHDNLIENNNEINFADPANIVALVPSGTGVLVLSSDENEIHDNTIQGNRSFGIGVISFETTGQPFNNPLFDQYAESNYVHGNLYDNNGTDPQSFIATVVQAAGVATMEDMFWDGVIDVAKDNTDGSLTNCFNANVLSVGGGPATYRMTDGLGGANQNTVLGANNCIGQTLPATILP